MSDLFWARSTMAFSLAFHIIFASISMVLPFFMALAHHRHLATRNEAYLSLTKAWSKGAAVLFATGAVSGTALSFQLGLLWPRFMQHAGPIFGMPFSLEGAAFFLEAIFLGLFLYGWGRISPRLHWWTGLMVGVCGLASGVLVIAANGWMNSPAGFDWVDGHAENIDPWAAMFNAAWPLQATHMLVAAVQATAFAAAGLHAFGLWQSSRSRSASHDQRGERDQQGERSSDKRDSADFHRKALGIILPFAAIASLVQPVIGDLSAKSVADRQPEKLAAMEAHFETERGAGLLVGGIPDQENQTVAYGLKIPKALSFLAHGNFDAEVVGLEEFPRDEQPPVLIVHLAFQLMVGLGMLMASIAAFWFIAKRWRPNWLEHPRFLLLLMLMTPAGFVALEAGWVVTEVGRQPWILYRILRTAESVTPVPGLSATFFSVLVLYLTLGALTFLVLARIYRLETGPRHDASTQPAQDVNGAQSEAASSPGGAS